jgi:acetyl-CoA synthetase
VDVVPRRSIGKKRCPIVDTWWQTETGAIMVTPLPGATPTQTGLGDPAASSASIAADVVDKEGKERPAGLVGGFLVVRRPWPSMLRTIYGDPARYQRQYLERDPGVLFHRRRGAQATRTATSGSSAVSTTCSTSRATGSARCRGRERARLAPQSGRGRGRRASRRNQGAGDRGLRHAAGGLSRRRTSSKRSCAQWVGKEIGSLAKPDDIRFSEALPKTRSGKIMRRLLREVALGGEVKGDTTTLEDFAVVATLQAEE